MLKLAPSVSGAPVVANLSATQRSGTKPMDIACDLSAPGFPTVAVDLGVSSDGGATWTVPAVSVSGDIGDEVRTWASTNGYSDLPTGGGKGTDHPAHSVRWYDVVKWCNARSEKEGLTPVCTVGGTSTGPGTARRRWIGLRTAIACRRRRNGRNRRALRVPQQRHPGGHEQLPRVPYRPQSSPLNGRQHSGDELPMGNEGKKENRGEGAKPLRTNFFEEPTCWRCLLNSSRSPPMAGCGQGGAGQAAAGRAHPPWHGLPRGQAPVVAPAIWCGAGRRFGSDPARRSKASPRPSPLPRRPNPKRREPAQKPGGPSSLPWPDP